MRPISAGVTRGILLLVTVLTIWQALAGLSASESIAAGGFGPSFRSCGSFHAGYKIHVYASHVSCRRAMRIQKEYWLAPPNRTVEVHRRHGPQMVLLKRFPGWKCFSGTGGGTCSKGRKVAAYTDV